MMVFVVGIFAYQLCTSGKVAASTNARGNMFFVVFFCYPTICIVSFASFICRPLTATVSVLEVDDGTICEDSSHTAMQWASVVVIVLIAIGLPIALFVLLYSKARNYEKNQRHEYLSVAQRMSSELKVPLTTAEFVIRDIVVGRDFSFVMDAFDPRYLYFESVDMLRKLALVGLVLVAGRGSIAQLASAICLSFIFFAIHLATFPYKVKADNFFRAATELHVFIVVTTALILKSDLNMEVVTESAYDYVLFFSFIAFVPVAFVVTVVSKVKTMAQVVDNGLTSVEPAEMRKRAFQLHTVGLGSDDDREQLRRYIDGWKINGNYGAFLSHFKAEAAAEARILKSELVRALRTDKIFLDADDLTDLTKLLEEVKNSDVFILMLTDGVLSRPWCLAELDAAAAAQVPIIVLSINNSYRVDTSRVAEILSDLPGYLKEKNPSAVDTLKEVMIDVDYIGPRILKAIQECEVDISTLTFDPNQSSVLLQSQIQALAEAMAVTACAENKALLTDMSPQEKDPWVRARKYAVYIVYSEASEVVRSQAERVKDWLVKRCDIPAEHVTCAYDDPAVRSIGDAVAGDCDDVKGNVDTVILLQSQGVLSEPRCLARLFAASKATIPIVTVNLTSPDPGHKELLWNFETAKPTMVNLGDSLPKGTSDALTAASGAAASEVGTVLSRVLPNIISKPLSIGGATSLFEAQMSDIELTLRREMPVDGDAVVFQPSTSPEQPKLRVRTSAKTPVTVRTGTKSGTDEGVPPPRVKAKIVVKKPTPAPSSEQDPMLEAPDV
jgi:hypothetical protein